MPAAAQEKPSILSTRLQRAYKINNIEYTKALGKMQLIEKAQVHSFRVTNNDIRLVNLALEHIQACSGHSPEGLPPDFVDDGQKEEAMSCFLYGERIGSRRFARKQRKAISANDSRVQRPLSKEEEIEEEEDDEDDEERDEFAFSSPSPRTRRVQSAAGCRRDSVVSDASSEASNYSVRPKSTPASRLRKNLSKPRFSLGYEKDFFNSDDENEELIELSKTPKPPGTPKVAFMDRSISRSRSVGAVSFTPGLSRCTSRASTRSRSRSSAYADLNINDLEKVLRKKVRITSADFVMPRKRPSRFAEGIVKSATPKMAQVVNRVQVATSYARRWRSAAAAHSRSKENDSAPSVHFLLPDIERTELKKALNEERNKVVEEKVVAFREQYPIKSNNDVSVQGKEL
ncbi:uncharacterized protein LOC106153643 [Lingula anatina]|uniref:Uncharacterized protein LOC106153643 n=1 Tax=Lingula anatina TaxID=7574 RepID=A0A1S3HAM9_LINAN|nr:uncharacterized protein LOC106153643 [Lingula anatina]|eukprot:XP_013383097.1 uncharacterized protein LOC106153643 [Lingula anatina]